MPLVYLHFTFLVKNNPMLNVKWHIFASNNVNVPDICYSLDISDYEFDQITPARIQRIRVLEQD